VLNIYPVVIDFIGSLRPLRSQLNAVIEIWGGSCGRLPVPWRSILRKECTRAVRCAQLAIIRRLGLCERRSRVWRWQGHLGTCGV